MFYAAYLKDKTLNPLNNCVDAAFFHSDDPEAAHLIAQARFADALENPNTFVELDPFDNVEAPRVFSHEEDD